MDGRASDGLFLRGTVLRVEAVKYGPKHPDKVGQEVSGFFRVVLSMFGAEQEATFNEVDRDTGERTQPATVLFDAGVIGQRVEVRCSAKGNGRWANFTCRTVELVPAAVPAL